MDDRGFDLTGDNVVADHRRDGHNQTEHGGEQGAADAGSKRLDIGLAGNRQLGECQHDAPYRSEQSQERADADGGRQKDHLAFKHNDLVGHGLFHGRPDDIDLFERKRAAGAVRHSYVHLADPEISRLAYPGGRTRLLFDPVGKGHRIAFRTEFFQECRTVPQRAFQTDPLVDHDAPGDHGKKEKDDHDPLSQHIGISESIVNVGIGQSGKRKRYHQRHFSPLFFGDFSTHIV